MSKADEAIAQIPGDLWRFFSERRWDEAKKLLAKGFEAYWPQTREWVRGRENFIEINRRYPGTRTIELQDFEYVYDRWELTYKVTTQVYIESKLPDGSAVQQYVVSMWNLDSGGLITTLQEFLADCMEPPPWRNGHVDRYSVSSST